MTNSYHKVFPTVRKNENCIACLSTDMIPCLSLGETALANSYVTSEDLAKEEYSVPLELRYCRSCHLLQLSHIVDRHSIFEHYAYFSSASPQLFAHFGTYAKNAVDRFPEQAKKLVIEIASNDGILLKFFKELGAHVLGVEPAKNVAQVANNDDIETIPEFFDSSIALRILNTYGNAGIISANNVLAHTDILRDIVQGVHTLLSPEGVFIFEVQYALDLITKNEFDNIYHEHISYFSLYPVVRLMDEFGMRVFDVEHVETQGGSLRVFAALQDSHHKKMPSVDTMLEKEHEAGLDKEETYKEFAKLPAHVREILPTLLGKIKSAGKRIVGYGAAAKGTTLLQYAGIGPELIEYITDSAPFKQGRFMPGTHIPIVSPDLLKTDPPDYILIIAWNYANSIMERERWFTENGGKFIIPVPEPRIVP